MSLSIAEVARAVDPLFPPRSLKTLLGRFRYLGADQVGLPPGILPNGTLSVRSVLSRVGYQWAHKRFLHYNCWLLAPKFEFSYFVKVVVGGWEHFILCAGISYAQLMNEAIENYVPTDDICDAIFPPVVKLFGISPNPANDACRSIHAVPELVDLLLGVLDFAIETIFDLLGVAEDLIIKAIEFLMFGPNGFPFTINFSAKPDIPERAFEIGREAVNYDIFSLVEVWDDSSKNKVLAFGDERLKNTPNLKLYQGSCFTGPGLPVAGSWKQFGSGLLVVAPQLSASDGGTSVYEPDGVNRKMAGGCDFGALVDTDRFANKGVQLTVIDLVMGKLDLYSTHLYSGGDGLNLPGMLGKPTDEEKDKIKVAQVWRLVDFISSTHDPSHVAMIAGDFNIAANKAIYTTFANALSQVMCRDFKPTTFDDLWVNPAYDDILSTLKDQGRTNRDDPSDHGDGHTDFSNVCAFKAPGSTVTPGNGQDFYCDDSRPDTGTAGERIDYIFLERPRFSHEFMLDVSRIRRRAFKRVQPGTVAYLSDHLGLEVTLLPSPIKGTPTPPGPPVIAKLAHSTIRFHTNDEDKDDDTHVTVTVTDSHNVAARVDDDFGHFDDDSDSGPFSLSVQTTSSKGELQRYGSVTIRVDPNGDDTWRFNFFLDLEFDDGSHLSGGADGQSLSEDDQERTFALIEILR
jgi:hypothetical protein